MATPWEWGRAPPLLASTLDGDVMSLTPLLLYPRELAPGTHCIRNRALPRAGVNAVELRKLRCGESNPVPAAVALKEKLIRHIIPITSRFM